jgi:hypothetical protein
MQETLRYSLGSALLLAMAAMANPAAADVFVYVEVEKDKAIAVDQDVVKVKEVDIDVSAEIDTSNAAQADALVNARNTDNIVTGSRASAVADDPARPFPDGDWDIRAFATIGTSVNDNTGIVNLNQDSGNMVNQGNQLAVAVVGPATTEAEPSITHAQAEGDQVNVRNLAVHSERFENRDAPADAINLNRAARITGSVNGNEGIVGVNQNAGNMNNQHNAIALAVGFESQVALTETALGQVNAFNQAFEVETVKLGLISGSASGNSGIVSINQSTGNMNNQATMISFGALTSTAAISVPGV